jgi:hypothetical protein
MINGLKIKTALSYNVANYGNDSVNLEGLEPPTS